MLISLVVLFFIISITTDSIRAKNNKQPIFAIKAKLYEDGGSKLYIGLFYNVYAIHEDQVKPEWYNEDGTLKEEYKDKQYNIYKKITPWFVSIDNVKEEN